jgi:hypothetical protein
VLAVVLLGVGACNPPCKRTCRKVLACGNLDTDRLALGACVEDCIAQENLYDTWKDKEKQALFVDHKQCLVQSSCEEIDEGVCYDGYEELFTF